MTWNTVIDKTSLIMCSLLVDVLKSTQINMFIFMQEEQLSNWSFLQWKKIIVRLSCRAVVTNIHQNR